MKSADELSPSVLQRAKRLANRIDPLAVDGVLMLGDMMQGRGPDLAPVYLFDRLTKRKKRSNQHILAFNRNGIFSLNGIGCEVYAVLAARRAVQPTDTAQAPADGEGA